MKKMNPPWSIDDRGLAFHYSGYIYIYIEREREIQREREREEGD